MENSTSSMQRRSETHLSQQQTGLATSLEKGIILREQKSKAETIEWIANLLQRLAKLYQIPNWTAENAVLLAEWTYDNYQYEDPDTIQKCLENPPATGQKNWRLTPDTITEWMVGALEQATVDRERIAADFKLREVGNEPLPNVDYNAFRNRMSTEGIQKETRADKAKEIGWQDPAYLKAKDDYIRERLKKQPEDPLRNG